MLRTCARLARMRRCVRVCATISCHVSSVGFETLAIASTHVARACAFRRGRCVTHLRGRPGIGSGYERYPLGWETEVHMSIVWFHSTSRRVPDQWL